MTVYVAENLEPSQTFETDIFGKTVKGFKLQLSVQELSLRYLNEILIKTYENFLKTLTEDSFEVFLKMYEKETPTQEFSCEYGKIFKNTFFYRMPPVAASGNLQKYLVSTLSGMSGIIRNLGNLGKMS